MRATATHETARSDILVVAGCLGLGMLALALPRPWMQRVAAGIRQTLLQPLVVMAARAAQDRSARFELRTLQHSRDSLAVLVLQQAALQRENDQLRGLVGVRARQPHPGVAAEVLHRPTPLDVRMLLIDAGREHGVQQFDPVITAEGLIGQVSSVGVRSSSVLTWESPDFAAAAVTADGRVSGFLRPAARPVGSQPMLELHGVALRDSLPKGAVVMTAGVGGTYPRGIPVGRVVSGGEEVMGYDRVYRVVPFANPGDASHVIVLTVPRDSAFVRPAPTVPRMVPRDSSTVAVPPTAPVSPP